MTVGQLMDFLEREVGAGRLLIDYSVAVWVKDGSGSEAVDLLDTHDIDNNEGFIAFHPDYTS